MLVLVTAVWSALAILHASANCSLPAINCLFNFFPKLVLQARKWGVIILLSSCYQWSNSWSSCLGHSHASVTYSRTWSCWRHWNSACKLCALPPCSLLLSFWHFNFQQIGACTQCCLQFMSSLLWAYTTLNVNDLKVLEAAKSSVLSKPVWMLQVSYEYASTVCWAAP